MRDRDAVAKTIQLAEKICKDSRLLPGANSENTRTSAMNSWKAAAADCQRSIIDDMARVHKEIEVGERRLKAALYPAIRAHIVDENTRLDQADKQLLDAWRQHLPRLIVLSDKAIRAQVNDLQEVAEGRDVRIAQSCVDEHAVEYAGRFSQILGDR